MLTENKKAEGIEECLENKYTVILTSAIKGAVLGKMALQEEPKEVSDR